MRGGHERKIYLREADMKFEGSQLVAFQSHRPRTRRSACDHVGKCAKPWIHAAIGLLAAATAMAASGCMPVTIRTQRVDPTVTITEVGSDWNPPVGPDEGLKIVDDVRRAMQVNRPTLEFVDPDMLWRESFPNERPGSRQPARDLLVSLNADGSNQQGVRCLIVLGPRTFEQYDASKAIGAPFYSAGPQKTSLQAVILRWGAAESAPQQVNSVAEGIEREGWIPGSVLLFVRFYKKVDTDGAALRGLVQGLLGALPAESPDAPLRLAVLAEADADADVKTTPAGK